LIVESLESNVIEKTVQTELTNPFEKPKPKSNINQLLLWKPFLHPITKKAETNPWKNRAYKNQTPEVRSC